MSKAFLRVLSFLMVCAMLCIAFAGCADDGKTDVTPTPSSDVTATPTDTEEEDPIPDYLATLPTRTGELKTYTILTRDVYRDEVYMAEEDIAGDFISQSVFNRNARVEEYKNVLIDYMDVKSGWNDMAEVIGVVRQSVTTGDGAFDLASTYMAYSAEMAAEGLFYNIMDVETINTENPWWVEGYVNNNIVFDCLYMIVGDLSLSMWENIYVTYFNKEVANNAGFTNLYALVENDEWTLETLSAMTSAVLEDNGDDVWDDKDTYGLLVNRHILRSWATSFDVRLTERNDDGGYDLCMYNDRSVEVYSTLHNYLFSDSGVFINQKDDGDTTVTTPMFKENRALFFMAKLGVGSDLRSMDTDFGILPVPKYDDLQDEYISHSYDGFSVFEIPLSHVDPEFAGEILEALNAESKKTVIPSYYDVVLKSRTTRDDDSAAMIDIARDGLLFDFAFTHYSAMNYMLSLWGDQLAKESSTSFTSIYEAKSTIFETKLQKLMDIYAGME